MPTLNNRLRPLWGRATAGLRYLITRSGPLALSVNQAGGFFRTESSTNGPNIQLYFNPMSYRTSEGTKAKLLPEPYPGFMLCFNPCRPESRGSIRLASPDPNDIPRIRLNYLATERDRREVIEAGCLVRRLIATPSLAEITAEEISPGPDHRDDGALLDYVRQNGGSIYHLCGTCAMGPDARNAVVDNRLRVHSVPGLRVVDASVFPNITSGNLNAPVMMIAERAATMIAEDRVKIKSEVPNGT